MCFEFDVHTGFCARFFAPSLSSKTAMYVVPNPGTIKSTHTAKTSPSLWRLPDSNGIVQYGGTDSNKHNNQVAKSKNSTSLFLKSMHNIGAIHISSKYGVSPRDQTTYNRRVSGTILKSRILKLDQILILELDQTRLCAGRDLFDLERFAIDRDLSYQQQANLILKQKKEKQSSQSQAGSQSRFKQ